ncbi:uncharacterized protein G2W53_030615 [Senna tora]|uniref:Uncharacterized protein n=1 Tax=Senna tora TaxID=362788 RepID=A0A834T9E4_9FABA|nr:uncharacterized protein G2W53_030615 [Senna tora]
MWVPGGGCRCQESNCAKWGSPTEATTPIDKQSKVRGLWTKASKGPDNDRALVQK